MDAPTNTLLRASKLPNVLGYELARILERRIVYLEILPNARITEQELCNEFNVSRSPVREAFRVLEASGLVVRHTRRGIRVTPMTMASLDEIYFCRIPLEGLAAAAAAQHATEADLSFLSERLESMTKALSGGKPEEFFDSNVAFLNRIHATTGNRLLTDLLSIIEKQALRYRYFAHARTRLMLELSYRGFRSVYEEIRSRRPAKAKSAAMKVMKESHRVIADALQSEGTVTDRATTARSRLGPPGDLGSMVR